jgi:hypothetical protein
MRGGQRSALPGPVMPVIHMLANSSHLHHCHCHQHRQHHHPLSHHHRSSSRNQQAGSGPCPWPPPSAQAGGSRGSGCRAAWSASSPGSTYQPSSHCLLQYPLNAPPYHAQRSTWLMGQQGVPSESASLSSRLSWVAAACALQQVPLPPASQQHLHWSSHCSSCTRLGPAVVLMLSMLCLTPSSMQVQQQVLKLARPALGKLMLQHLLLLAAVKLLLPCGYSCQASKTLLTSLCCSHMSPLTHTGRCSILEIQAKWVAAAAAAVAQVAVWQMSGPSVAGGWSRRMHLSRPCCVAPRVCPPARAHQHRLAPCLHHHGPQTATASRQQAWTCRREVVEVLLVQGRGSKEHKWAIC